MTFIWGKRLLWTAYSYSYIWKGKDGRKCERLSNHPALTLIPTGVRKQDLDGPSHVQNGLLTPPKSPVLICRGRVSAALCPGVCHLWSLGLISQSHLSLAMREISATKALFSVVISLDSQLKFSSTRHRIKRNSLAKVPRCLKLHWRWGRVTTWKSLCICLVYGEKIRLSHWGQEQS